MVNIIQIVVVLKDLEFKKIAWLNKTIHTYTTLHAFFKLFPKLPSLRILLNVRVRVCKGVFLFINVRY